MLRLPRNMPSTFIMNQHPGWHVSRNDGNRGIPLDIGVAMYDISNKSDSCNIVYSIPLVQHINILHCSILLGYFQLVHTMGEVIIPFNKLCTIATRMGYLFLNN